MSAVEVGTDNHTDWGSMVRAKMVAVSAWYFLERRRTDARQPVGLMACFDLASTPCVFAERRHSERPATLRTTRPRHAVAELVYFFNRRQRELPGLFLLLFQQPNEHGGVELYSGEILLWDASGTRSVWPIIAVVRPRINWARDSRSISRSGKYVGIRQQYNSRALQGASLYRRVCNRPCISLGFQLVWGLGRSH